MLKGLTVYRSLTNQKAIQALLNRDEKAALSILLDFAETRGVGGPVLGFYIFYWMAGDDNVFSRAMELKGACGESLCGYVKQDIGLILQFIKKHESLLIGYVPSSPADETPFYASIQNMADGIPAGVESVFSALSRHYQTLGRSVAAQYIALGWQGRLMGIENFDNIRFGDLIGIELQKEALVKNTQRLLQGRQANNVLLFGDSGTGKSSCVKALVNEYHGQGLRLLELRKSELVCLDGILEILEKSRYKYIIFLDDLSFEEGELGYKALKAVLEGKAAKIPANVVFYATSNRKHLVRETWADRVVESEEVHISDTVHEKLSLSERFGIRITFTVPSQAHYLKIVEELCAKHGIIYDETIKTEALQWAIFYNGFSGRTAKQFVISKTNGCP